MKIQFVDILTERDHPSDPLCRVGIRVEHKGETRTFVADCFEPDSRCADSRIGAITAATKNALQKMVDECAC